VILTFLRKRSSFMKYVCGGRPGIVVWVHTKMFIICRCSFISLPVSQSLRMQRGSSWRRFSSPRTKLLAARCECLHLIKINCLALWLDESAHASLAASCEELRARTANPP
jgi:hypothetical protein